MILERLKSEWNFWIAFPNSIIGVLCVGLVVSGVTMFFEPEGYRSFYLGDLTPRTAGVASVLCAALCLVTRASYAGLALAVATFAGRGVLLFTAWSTGRVIPAPPATRWIWEIVNVVVILLAAGKIRRTVH